jgi:ribonucleotide monophosphatase NagD (HAD superfamily)
VTTRAYLIDRDGVLNRGTGSPLRPAAVRWLEALGARGIPFLVATNHSTSSPAVELTDGAEADTVLLAFDRTMSYSALSVAITAVHEHGAHLIALHENRIFRDAEGRLEPGLGAWLRAIEYATGVEALVVGKPSAAYYRAALDRLGTAAQETTMISDDPFGDLAGAKALGMRTVFVLSGKYADPGILASPALAARPDQVVAVIEALPAGDPTAET